MAKKKDYLIRLITMIIKNQSFFGNNLSLKDKWWISKNGEGAVQLFTLSVTRKQEFGKIQSVCYENSEGEKEEIQWKRRAEKKNITGSLKLPEVMSQFVLYQDWFDLTEEQTKEAVRKKSRTLKFFLEILLNREIISMAKIADFFQDSGSLRYVIPFFGNNIQIITK